MKHVILSAVALLMAGAAWAQDIQREELRRADVPGSDTMEVVVTRLTVPVGATIPLHTHPGDEHAIVMTAARAEAPNGNIVEFAVGTPLYFPEGQVHGGLTNMGDEPMVAITTHVVRKGEPLTVLAN
ncbi:cupin domain-containing protein [uncultured Tateyamaria sp.]|uniref:cupin domain-containing protein n=1 Tax=uncultured Tateyamaria sp. TaxID=455651 RepID=UPI00261A0751|nr:cupin domain-containing protein [uncultured Tateyamaria sp.]